MDESILNSIKRQIGEDPAQTAFDVPILSAINSAFFVLYQLGVGPSEPYRIKDSNNEWSEFTEDHHDLEAAKTYMPLKVRMLFDPPTSGILKQALEDSISELEFRLSIQTETFRRLEER